MTTEELRLAAKRILSSVSGRYRPDLNYNDLTPFPQDAVTLAEAWLAEHPADGEELVT